AEDPDPFEPVYRATLVNYEQGRAWRRGADGRYSRFAHSAGRRPGEGPGAPMSPVAGAPLAAVSVPDTSIYVGRDWIKIAVDSTGFYKVGFDELRTLPLFGNSTTVRLDSLRLFTWPGFPVLPENSYCDPCDYREVAMGFVEAAPTNGLFDDNREYFYFYALGASGWGSLYDPTRPDTSFIDHP